MGKSEIVIDASTMLNVIDHLTGAAILVNQNRRVILANQTAKLFTKETKKNIRSLQIGKVLGCVIANLSSQGCGYDPQCDFCLIKTKVEETFFTREGALPFKTSVPLKELGQRKLRVGTSYFLLDGADAVLVSVNDVSGTMEREQLKFEKLQLESAVETFGALCSELSNPLTIITGLLELLLLEVDSSETHHMTIEKIRQQILLVNKIVRNFR
jgi:nitrogen-specific signal transduction histidine kinase